MKLYNIWIITTLQVILCQVRTDIQLLQYEFFNERKGLSWFIMSDMQDNAKFLLCVDVYQKFEKKRMMEGRYITTGEYNILLPEFKLDNITVAGIYKYSGQLKSVTSIHCPFSKIAFEKNSYIYGSDFYITASADKFCVYILTSNGTIIGKVCNVMADIRKNREELTTELISFPNIHLMREEEWEPFLQDNQFRYVTCMDVYGKIVGLHLCNYRVNGELPIFKRVVLRLSLATGTRNLSAILCPLHKLKFAKRALAISSVFYIAPSVNKGCVYKLATIKAPYASHLIDEVYIEEEICGIFEPVRRDIQQLEEEFLYIWNDVSHFPNNEIVPWTDLSSLENSMIDVLRICENIYLKLHHTSLFRDKRINMRKPKELELHFQTTYKEPRKIWGVYCPMHLLNKNRDDMGDIQPYYITNSVNIGCVYVLFSKMRKVSTLIQYEVCGVYPISYLFNI